MPDIDPFIAELFRVKAGLLAAIDCVKEDGHGTGIASQVIVLRAAVDDVDRAIKAYRRDH